LIFRRYRTYLVLVAFAILLSLGIWFYVDGRLAAPSVHSGPLPPGELPPQVACGTATNLSVFVLPNSLLNMHIRQAAADMAAAQATLNAVEASGNALQIAQAQQAYQFAKDRYNAMVAQAQSPTIHGSFCTQTR